MQHELQTLTVISSTFYPELIGTIVTRVSEVHNGHYNVVTHTGHVVTFDTFFDSTVDSAEYEDNVNANCEETIIYVAISGEEITLAGLECIFPYEDVMYALVQHETGDWLNVPFSAISVVATRKAA